jgi:hypothetical protein
MSYDNYPETDWHGKRTSSDTKKAASSKNDYSENDFEELSINQNKASGPYHINHFISFFEVPIMAKWSHIDETKELFQEFKSYFDNDFTIVNFSKKKWQNKHLAGFNTVVPNSPWLSLFGFMAHTDWVTIEEWQNENDDGFSIFGTTLKDTREEGFVEDLLESQSESTMRIDTDYHFLSGRRSWKFGVVNNNFIRSPNLCYIETAALERFSLPEYDKMDTGKNPPLIRSLVNQVWISMLKKIGTKMNRNFIDLSDQFCQEVYNDDGGLNDNKFFDVSSYNVDRRNMKPGIESIVYYKNDSFEKIEDLDDSPWFFDILERHACLRIKNMPK